ncbi:MAG: outer membrane lipoprotein-sorting protein [Planctomycetota bacterium]
MTPRLALLASLVCLALAPGARADEPSAKDIMNHVDKDHRSKDEEGVVEMVLVTKDERKQTRKMEMLFLQGEGEDDKHRLRFMEPANVAGLTLLTHEATGRADDQWVYLPEFKKVKKIASSKRTNRFAQTDFTYEDLRTEDLSAYEYTRKGEEKVQNADCYVIEATPKNPETSGYSKRLIYVEKARYLLFKVVFFDPKGRKLKTLENRGYEQVNGLWRAKMSVMEDHQRESKTAWRFVSRKINAGISDSKFTVASLEKGA